MFRYLSKKKLDENGRLPTSSFLRGPPSLTSPLVGPTGEHVAVQVHVELAVGLARAGA